VQVDILVNNGARLQLYPLTKTPLKVDRAILDVNTVGTISLTKAILPHMIKRQEGQIVVVSSAVGKHGFPYEATYSASKHALQGYFDSARLELEEHNIGVQIILPGPVISQIFEYAATKDVNIALKDTPHYIGPSVTFMPTERCAKLMAVSMANNLDEVWISEYPFLQLLYLNQYFPDLAKWILKPFLKQINFGEKANEVPQEKGVF